MSTTDRAAPAHLGALYPFLYAQPAPDRGRVHGGAGRLHRGQAARGREAARPGAHRAGRGAGGLRAGRWRSRWTPAGGCSRSATAAARPTPRPAPTCSPTPPDGYGAPALAAYALSADVAVLSALANDVGVEAVFARQIAAHARPGDVAVGFSTSGNSPNLVAAFDRARRCGMVTVGFSGGGGGRLAEPGAVDHLFVVRSPSVHRIQEAQTTACHVLWELTVAELCGADGRPSAAQGVYADDRNTGAACADR